MMHKKPRHGLRVSAAGCVLLALAAGCAAKPRGTATTLKPGQTPVKFAVIAERVRGELKKLLDSEWADIRKGGIRLLASFPDDNLLPLAARLALSDENPEVRAAAAIALQRLNNTEAEGILLKVAGDPHPTVRYAALKALLAREDADEAVLSMLQDDLTGADEEERVRALTFLAEHPELEVHGWVAPPESGTAVERLLTAAVLLNSGVYSGVRLLQASASDANPALRNQAARVTGYLVNAHELAGALLKQLLLDEDPAVRQSAALSAQRLRLPTLAFPLAGLLNSESAGERATAIRALRKICSGQSALILLTAALEENAEALYELARSTEPPWAGEVREIAREQMDDLRRIIAFSEDETFIAAGLRLQLALGDQHSLSRLETVAFISPIARVRMIGIEALGIYGDKHSLRRLIRAFFRRSSGAEETPGSVQVFAQDRLLMAEAILSLGEMLYPDVPSPVHYAPVQ